MDDGGQWHHASGDAVVSLDADLQDPPEVIEQMIEAYRSGAERWRHPVPGLWQATRARD